MDQDFIALAKAAQKQGMKQAITSYNSIGMVFVDGQLTGGPALLKAVLAKTLGDSNNFLIFAFESRKPDTEGKNVHLQMLMQQLNIQHKSTVLLIDDYDVNVDLAKEAGYSTAKARTGRGVDLRMLAS
jgi:phosphoglycolate phosphatase-like HAD superfamily hydrolase